jgi:hypothetical protein
VLPIPDSGGESFRSSFALSQEDTPSAANVPYWGNLIAHEFFHYWNGSRLHGADYASTNWIREGFTEYAANMALTRAGVLDEPGIRAKLAKHVDNYGKLATPLDAPGDHGDHHLRRRRAGPAGTPDPQARRRARTSPRPWRRRLGARPHVG